MKILIATDWYKPIVNGVVTSVTNLERELLAKGHDVRILTLSNSLHSRKEGNVYYIKSVSADKLYPGARAS
ncbi:MAG TPA: glycosyltransferase family 4 protein, partial [Tissierellales bacterium]|nr:glycosyltransferase family 4 protein [Tissierellales bacterium]